MLLLVDSSISGCWNNRIVGRNIVVVVGIDGDRYFLMRSDNQRHRAYWFNIINTVGSLWNFISNRPIHCGLIACNATGCYYSYNTPTMQHPPNIHPPTNPNVHCYVQRMRRESEIMDGTTDWLVRSISFRAQKHVSRSARIVDQLFLRHEGIRCSNMRMRKGKISKWEIRHISYIGRNIVLYFM